MIDNRIVTTDFGPMIINSNDQYIGRSLEQLGHWARTDIDLMAGIIQLLIQRRGPVRLYDVGANIGTHTVALARIFRDEIQIRSFEAQRQIFYMLCGNVAINGLDRVWCHHAAVSDTAAQPLTLALPDYNQVNNFGGFEVQPAERSDNQSMTRSGTEAVTTVTLDQFAEPVDFLKLDVEGMEHLALRGSGDLVSQYRPVCLVEMLKTDQAAVRKFFRDQDYTAYAPTPDDWWFFPAEGDLGLSGCDLQDLKS